jgi:ABC-type molybdate transport system ATPase subunit
MRILLLSKPRLLLLDEPLGSLDEGRRTEILPYLVRLRDEARVPMVMSVMTPLRCVSSRRKTCSCSVGT